MKKTEFFLGANSGEGFYSLYDQLFTDALDDLLILKGSPGCGKSTVMKKIGAAAEQAGLDVHYIRCSGDPDSLDGVIIPALRSAVVDGTAPHVLEPRCPLARERYCDLSAGADLAGIKAQRTEIAAAAEKYRAHYKSAYRILRAMQVLEEQRRSIAAAETSVEKLGRRMQSIARRELKGCAAGREAKVFLGGLTHKGRVSTLESMLPLCPRVYLISDQYGLAQRELRSLYSVAREKGGDLLVGMDPDRPAQLKQLLLLEQGLAFAVADGKEPCPAKPYRHIRADAAAAEEISRGSKARLRFSRRILRALEEDARGELERAKAAHDMLEGLYRPYMDFSLAEETAAREIRRLLG